MSCIPISQDPAYPIKYTSENIILHFTALKLFEYNYFFQSGTINLKGN